MNYKEKSKLNLHAMILSDEELIQAKALAEKNPVVKKMLEELISYDEDISKLYYTTLAGAIKEICQDIRDKVVDLDNSYTKTILKLAETGDKVFNTLQRGKQDSGPPEDADTERTRKLKKANNVAT